MQGKRKIKPFWGCSSTSKEFNPLGDVTPQRVRFPESVLGGMRMEMAGYN